MMVLLGKVLGELFLAVGLSFGVLFDLSLERDVFLIDLDELLLGLF